MDLLIGQMLARDAVIVDGYEWVVTVDKDLQFSFVNQYVEIKKGMVARHYGLVEPVLAVKSASFLINGHRAEFLGVPDAVIEKIRELSKYLEDNAGKFRIVIDAGA